MQQSAQVFEPDLRTLLDFFKSCNFYFKKNDKATYKNLTKFVIKLKETVLANIRKRANK